MINQDATLDEIRQAGFDPLLRARALGNETVEELGERIMREQRRGSSRNSFRKRFAPAADRCDRYNLSSRAALLQPIFSLSAGTIGRLSRNARPSAFGLKG